MSFPYWLRAGLQQEREDDLRRQDAHAVLVRTARAEVPASRPYVPRAARRPRLLGRALRSVRSA